MLISLLLRIVLLFILHGLQCSAQEVYAPVPSPFIDGKNAAEDPISGIEFIQPDDSLECPEQPLHAYLISHDPLVIYLENFVSANESEHLIQQSSTHLAPAAVYQVGTTGIDQSARKSRTALLDRDATVRCIEQRTRRIQEWNPAAMALERITVQRYDADGFFRHHYDWFGRAPAADRISTVNVFLQGVGDCEGGGTHFPYLRMPPGAAAGASDSEALCRFVDCEAAAAGLGGVTFLPVARNAIYWDNVRRDGSGYMETLHAGMPVQKGTKIGLNIWSWAVPEARGQP